VPDSALDAGDRKAGIAFVPGAVEVFGGQAKPDDEVSREVLRPDLAALLLPQANQRFLVPAHDDAGVGAANKVAAFILTALVFDSIRFPAHHSSDLPSDMCIRHM
jgi:hypothetical protein